mgnify:CR=1 FL=1
MNISNVECRSKQFELENVVPPVFRRKPPFINGFDTAFGFSLGTCSTRLVGGGALATSEKNEETLVGSAIHCKVSPNVENVRLSLMHEIFINCFRFALGLF